MKRYADKKKSSQVCKKNKKYISKKLCYNNVFSVYTNDDEIHQKIEMGEIMIEYGYVEVFEDVYTRHAYFVDMVRETVIDPTLPLLDSFEEKKTIAYIPLHSFKEEEYLEAIESESNMPALMRYLRKKDHKLQRDLFDEGIICVG